MKLSTALNYAGDPKEAAVEASQLEGAGIDMIWVAEPYGFDAVSILGFLAAHTQHAELASGILPIFSRTPTLTAMTAAGLDMVSSGRFALGLGTSGPQVIEGWHGVPYDRPLRRTREVIDICRLVWKREPLRYDGQAYTLPLPADQGTGLGKPLKMIHPPLREQIPIYLAALGPKNVQMAAELADGWFPAFFYPEKADIWCEDLDAGFEHRDSSLGPLEIVSGGTTAICGRDEAEAIINAERPRIALYIGGMGPRDKNFYNNVFRRLGYEEEADQIQELFLAGKRKEAEAAVPESFLRATTLVGDASYVRERVQAFQEAGVTRLNITPATPEPLKLISTLKSWVS
ncbi:LLM class F420-dependent oxidoreductase [Nocardioides marmoriginsengisoli]|uniref:LLM class F420-dependent oxidoreductase n=1 Tax=Nocardioides marmoriginsengisoli TaxID=661483 RepID=A0A3N0CIY3_9ACTN|nr:LLM class F420-dependent oxidoreductase [Nocardioides marmoriginsengisoli]RNL62903.1 LLM class F420-dependent oxidoreductase [Nocardioides marmoriginsengisoli]